MMGNQPRPADTTLGELRAAGWRSQSVKEELRANLLARIAAGEPFLPGILGYDETVLPQLENAILAGQDVCLLGERGQAKSRLARLLVGLLEADGLIDVENPIDHYMPELSATYWSGIRIIDILDMASGLDLVESEQSRTSPMSTVGAFFRIELGDTSRLGERTSDQILFAAGRKGPPGELFEYSSLNTKMLGLLAERAGQASFAPPATAAVGTA